MTDINYSTITSFTEREFVVPGPGAINGIRKCFSDTAGLNDAEVIRFMADRQEMEFERLGIRFRSLWGRRLQLIDCQTLSCEVDKYAVQFGIRSTSGCPSHSNQAATEAEPRADCLLVSPEVGNQREGGRVLRGPRQPSGSDRTLPQTNRTDAPLGGCRTPRRLASAWLVPYRDGTGNGVLAAVGYAD